jgi:ice-binding like protein
MHTRNETSIRFFASLLAAFLVAGGGCGGDGGADRPGSTLLAGAGTGAAGLGHGPAPVDLGMAGDYVILAKSASSSVPTSAVTGNIGLSPSAASFITGYSLVMDASGTFSTASQVTGQILAADYTEPTPTNLTVSVLNMEAAYTDAAGRAPDYIELAAGDIGGLSLPPATYKWGTGVVIPTSVTLTGGPNDVWIFQIAQNLTVSSAVQVILAGGAKPEHIFWQVFGAVEIGTTSHFEGVILSQTSIVLNTGATVNGRLLAQTAVTLDANAVTQP